MTAKTIGHDMCLPLMMCLQHDATTEVHVEDVQKRLEGTEEAVT